MNPEDQSPNLPPAPPVPEPAEPKPFFERRKGRILLYTSAGLFATFLVVFGYFYLKFGRLIDARLAAGPFSGTTNIYTAPRDVAVGDPITPSEVVARLRRAGYTTNRGNPVGWYNLRAHAVEIFPGRDSYAGGEPGVLEFADGRIARVISLQDNTGRQKFLLEPQLIANLSPHREKRRLVRFADIPTCLVQAVISAEDKHFFHHSGFDLFRIAKAAYVDAKDGRKEQGASTLTMQLARGFWLDADKNWKRKFEELLLTMHLEFRLTKPQIFEDYANQVYLGWRGGFSIDGFGEASRVYFNQDLSQLTLPEAALLAGMVQRPSYFNPYRYPERARERRDVVLQLMRDNGYLTGPQYRQAIATPLTVSPVLSEGTQMQYFVDLMNDELQRQLDEGGKNARYIYTTLDPDLQQVAQDAVASGMHLVDTELHKGRRSRIPADQPQVALIAVDPETGEIRALVGGRNYANSQLNHALAMRQPGSVFKPFVYAAALDTAISGGPKIFTPSSTVTDAPTAFYFGRQVYQPANFRNEYLGAVTLRSALAHSLNNATVELAQEVGYQRVVDLAHRMGLNDAIQPTPALALGAYEATPLEIAGAYTAFANNGRHISPTAISLIRGSNGTVLYQHSEDATQVLDPRVNYLMVNMMEDVLRYGTAAAVHAHGFRLPAAGKTGTSRDGWFAGFTSRLLCVVWVGFDDNRPLNLEGARSALPIWTEFMKRAAAMRQYSDVRPFSQPAGIVTVRVCGESGELAGPDCPDATTGVFIDGTQPVVACHLHSPNPQQYSDRVEEEPDYQAPPAAPNAFTAAPAQKPATVPAAPARSTVPAAAKPANTPPALSGAPNVPTTVPEQPMRRQ